MARQHSSSLHASVVRSRKFGVLPEAYGSSIGKLASVNMTQTRERAG